MRLLAPAAILIALAAPAAAQVERLPARSPAEIRIDQMNRDIAAQQRDLQARQQTQFEINQLRGQIQRDSIAPPVIAPRGTCPPGAIC
ncbi:MAG TPA: hypothetical protein VM434_01420 [Beijerinckiaceae bacterium]|nr:hypothetical protein [Beijerinckiaceae bacterium]